MKKRLLLSLIILAAFSCTKENNELRLSDFNTPVVKGYYLRDDFGFFKGVVGIPNIKQGNGDDYENSQYYFTFFPNPAEDFCSIDLKAPTYGEVIKLWITPAYMHNSESNSLTGLSNTYLITIGGSPVYQNEFNSVSFIGLDLSHIPAGYYRINLKIKDYFLYDNLVVYKPNR
jgi:hypothetical protein